MMECWSGGVFFFFKEKVRVHGKSAKGKPR